MLGSYKHPVKICTWTIIANVKLTLCVGEQAALSVIMISSICTCQLTHLPLKNGRHFADENFKRIFLNENGWILIEISLKFIPLGPIGNKKALD